MCSILQLYGNFVRWRWQSVDLAFCIEMRQQPDDRDGFVCGLKCYRCLAPSSVTDALRAQVSVTVELHSAIGVNTPDAGEQCKALYFSETRLR